MKTFYASFILMLSACFGVFAQEEDEKITVEITKEINGEKQTFKGEYNSRAEMEADPNYQEFAGDASFDMWSGSSADMQILMDQFGSSAGSFFKQFDFDPDAGGFSFHHFDDDSAADWSGQTFHFNFDDLDIDKYRQHFEQFGMDVGDLMNKLGALQDTDDPALDDREYVEISNDTEAFGKAGVVNEKNTLILDDLRVAPLSESSFSVRFTTPQEGELSIRVLDMNGKELHKKYFERFNGMYMETINLSNHGAGTYLFEIAQGKKRLVREVTTH